MFYFLSLGAPSDFLPSSVDDSSPLIGSAAGQDNPSPLVSCVSPSHRPRRRRKVSMSEAIQAVRRNRTTSTRSTIEGEEIGSPAKHGPAGEIIAPPRGAPGVFHPPQKSINVSTIVGDDGRREEDLEPLIAWTSDTFAPSPSLTGNTAATGGSGPIIQHQSAEAEEDEGLLEC